MVAEQTGAHTGGMDTRTFPEALPDISRTAAALADASRAAMCSALMDGRAWTVGELANYCGLARSTASEHVDLLTERGLVLDIRQGRHRYVRLAGSDIARVIESLGIVAQSKFDTAHSLRASSATDRARAGRTCYKHLAGRLGVALAEQLHDRDCLNEMWEPTAAGRELLAAWGLPHAQSVTATPCMDSTERRFHLAGPLGKELCSVFFDKGWIERLGATRAVRLTDAGTTALADSGIRLLTAVAS
ncbi:hypothetical protein CCASEI_11770 [Corynebacterium casei LMG S-19264]|uniref:Transcriptional regulator, ArsR family n=4 Tax=Actinomycetes TaxID=1760 RepID=A0A2H1IEG5_BRELN|nr:hypothetical protein CCASEI_11770 [Corynebacterium casei LMG S-19264]SMX69549.1 transcriptional regulator, ArsR family [Brevibacterium antiquum]SMX73534.1 transcriptional regulator, ArsR family [Brevibacterium linens ATCC 9172]SMY04836.1 transcriptional regulator, ArsR family [Brevibacterium antiquum CNRZ 918]